MTLRNLKCHIFIVLVESCSDLEELERQWAPSRASERLGPVSKEDRIESHNWLPKTLQGKRKNFPRPQKEGKKLVPESPRVFRSKNFGHGQERLGIY